MNEKSVCGEILTGENWSTRRKTCPNVTLSAIISTWTGLESNRATGVTDLRLTAR